jgi:hypothetical protein
MADAPPLDADWDRAFARQAVADYRFWSLFESDGELEQARSKIALCQRLMLLQMACEKLCKAYAYREGTTSKDLQASHAYIAKRLPLILRQIMQDFGHNPDSAKFRDLVKRQRLIARELELLQPAVDENGRRPDNCEYPWQDGTVVRSPLDYPFAIADLLQARPFGPTILKWLKTAFEREATRLHAP